MPRLLLHLEGAIVFLTSLYFYQQNDFSWLAFVFLLLVFDISMLGYLVNERAGAVIYNISHSYILPVVLILVAIITSVDWLLMISLIWMAHNGMDRMFGYGLKYPSGFKDTHFQKV
ncbi:DUF4260 domain-containing protein [Halobacillus sp. Nhm2S1]|uniref:DUF4260 domain-containing protein n=1 Tax=Halobacillus sp. Nhm2S1 TaxID=2866716 RepID=UPI001C734B7A|nr:DUF4260 domain-containing protein [Halobacillus sp. Nhm2S1]MBX0356080.1 DUF4260 domain-containing protein [Halobacillus sp. Nhm2S1]